MKKKILLFGLLTVLVLIGYVIYDEISYSPLEEVDFVKLFGENNNSFQLECDVYFIGWSPDGAIYDFYMYNILLKNIKDEYPLFNKNNKHLKWTKTPIDSIELLNEPFTLRSKTLNDNYCSRGFIEKYLLNNGENYYCYEIIDEREYHYYVYCSSEKKLMYLRRKGW